MEYVSGLAANLYNLSSEKALKIANKNHRDLRKMLGDFPQKVGEKREKEGEKREKDGDILRYLARKKPFQERRGKTLMGLLFSKVKMGLLFSKVKMGHGIFHLKNLVKRVISCRFAAMNATP